jgi:hypothetical protein
MDILTIETDFKLPFKCYMTNEFLKEAACILQFDVCIFASCFERRGYILVDFMYGASDRLDDAATADVIQQPLVLHHRGIKPYTFVAGYSHDFTMQGSVLICFESVVQGQQTP